MIDPDDYVERSDLEKRYLKIIPHVINIAIVALLMLTLLYAYAII